jgi:hypothetical protein
MDATDTRTPKWLTFIRSAIDKLDPAFPGTCMHINVYAKQAGKFVDLHIIRLWDGRWVFHREVCRALPVPSRCHTHPA